MSADRSVEAGELFARAARGLSRARLERAAEDLSAPLAERLSEQRRAQTLHILNDLFDSVEDALRQSLAVSLAAAGPAGRAAASGIGRGGAGLVWSRVEAVVLSSPLDLLDVALTRASEHALSATLRLSAPADGALAKLLARHPDSDLSQRVMDLVVADSRRLDSFGEPRVPFDMLGEEQASRVGWLTGAVLRDHVAAQNAVDEEALDNAVEQAVRHLLADRNDGAVMRKAVKLVSRLEAIEALDADLLSAFAGEGHLTLLAAALARLSGLEPQIVLQLLFGGDEAGWLMLLRALDLPDGPMRAVATAITANSDDPTPVKTRVKRAGAVSLADARRLVARWRRDTRYAEAVAAISR